MFPIVTSSAARSPLVLSLVLLAACSSSSAGGAPPADGGAPDHHTSDTGVAKGDSGGAKGDAGSGKDAGMADRGPTAIAIAGADPNGIFWDAATSTLYIADNQNDRVMTWTDGGGFKVLATLPGPPGNEVGGIVKTADGTLVVIEFGFGTSGLIALVHPDGSTGTVPSLDPTKRRLGIALAPDGTLYDSYFDKVVSGYTGFVAKLDVTAGTEVDQITGLGKPVGVAVIGTTLYVSDQQNGDILAAPVSSPQGYKAIATMLSPDLLSVGPNDTIFSGSPDGVVYQIDGKTGSYNTLFMATGSLQPRGTAYDAANKRLFVAEHDGVGTMNYIEIVPVGG